MSDEQTTMFVTRDYAKFRITDANRDTDPRDVAELVEEMRRKPFTREFPIVVNSHMEVMDGQHRLQAIEQLKLPLYYIVSERMTMQDVAQAQAVTKAWTLDNYMAYYVRHARANRTDYIRVQEIVGKYGVSVSTALALGAVGRSVHPEFKQGRLNYARYEHAKRVLEYAQDFRGVYNEWNNGWFLRALSSVVEHPNYSHERMMSKVRQWPDLLGPRSNVQSYTDMLINLYNRHSRNPGKDISL
jgi:hypothetical protein